MISTQKLKDGRWLVTIRFKHKSLGCFVHARDREEAVDIALELGDKAWQDNQCEEIK